MMKIQYLFLLLLFTTSCTERGGCDEERIDLIMSNQTNHSIKCEVYIDGHTEGLYDIRIMDKYTITGEAFFPFEIADSAIVIYDNQYQITHYKNSQNNGAGKSILNLSNGQKYMKSQSVLRRINLALQKMIIMKPRNRELNPKYKQL